MAQSRKIMSEYTVFKNGRRVASTSVIGSALDWGQGIGMCEGMDFVNTKSPLIIAKWTGKKGCVIVQKSKTK